MTKTIWLIRHGESIGNAGGVTEAPHSIGLSEKGAQQAQQLADHFPKAPDLIVVTPYVRTHLTAAPLRQRFPHVPVTEWPLHEFTYLAPARYAGTTQDDREGPVQDYWNRCDPHFIDGEGAENFVDFVGRLRRLDALVHDTTHRFIALFCHAYVIKGILWNLQQNAGVIDATSMKDFMSAQSRLRVRNASVTPLQFAPDAPPVLGAAWLPPYEAPPPVEENFVPEPEMTGTETGQESVYSP
jgi:broad specificity phosphatase PhoE